MQKHVTTSHSITNPVISVRNPPRHFVTWAETLTPRIARFGILGSAHWKAAGESIPMITRKCLSIAGAVLLATGIAARAVEPVASENQSFNDDVRRLVSMPAPAQQLLRKDMIDYLVVMNQLFAHLAASEFQDASELAEARLGRSSMGKHRGTGMGPGRFMPPEMHQLGIAMHQSASDFAETVKNQDPAEAYGGLQRVTSSCVACHMSFRVR